jgi:hypothetical protein
MDVMPSYREVDEMDESNRHVFCMNIKNVQCPHAHLPIFLRQTTQEYELFDRDDYLVIYLDTNHCNVDVADMVIRVSVE